MIKIEWTIWINPYCPWLKILKNISSSKKELSMELYVESLKGQYGSIHIYLDLSLLYVLLIKIDQCFLNGRYRSNHIVRFSNFLKASETHQKAWVFNERTICVKTYCPWYNFLKKFLNTKKSMSFRWKYVLDLWKENI